MRPLDAGIEQFLEAYSATPYVHELGIVYRGHGPDWAEMALPYRERLIAFPDDGFIASGAIFALADTTAGLAVFSALPQLEPIATLDLRLDYLRPATPGLDIVARVSCEKLTRRVGFVRGACHDGDPERPVAHITGTFMRTTAP